jgi:hypothetical protein
MDLKTLFEARVRQVLDPKSHVLGKHFDDPEMYTKAL